MRSDFSAVDLNIAVDRFDNLRAAREVHLCGFLRRLVGHIGIGGTLFARIEHFAFLVRDLAADRLVLSLQVRIKRRVSRLDDETGDRAESRAPSRSRRASLLTSFNSLTDSCPQVFPPSSIE